MPTSGGRGRSNSLSVRSTGKVPSHGGKSSQEDPLVVLQDLLDYHSWGKSVPSIIVADGQRNDSQSSIVEETLLKDMQIGRDEDHFLVASSDKDKQVQGFQTLHSKVSESDELLKQVQDYMVQFRDDLTAVSADIETLQAKSQRIHCQIANRRHLDSELSKPVSVLIVPPDHIQIIAKDSISIEWVHTLDSILQQKKEIHQYIATKQYQENNNIPQTVQESNKLIDLVIAKALERSRDFLVSRIKSLRKIGVNAQNIQQQQFIKYKRIYEFLHSQSPQLGKEIGIAYVNTMKWYYASHFNRYAKALSRMRTVKVTDRNFLLGGAKNTDPNRPGRMQLLLSQRANGNNSQQQSQLIGQDPLVLGNRAEVLNPNDHSVIKAQAAEQPNQQVHWMETGFRSFNLALMENAATEYQFITQFFGFETPEHQANVFNSVFKRTFDLGIAYSKSLFDESLDAIGILLCIRLCQNLQFELQRRCIPVMENYLTLQTLTLWPRFQQVMDAHCESLIRASSRTTSVFASTASSPGIAPHPLTQAFASFLYALLTLSPEDMESEPVSISLVRFRNDFEAFLTKLCHNLPSQQQKEKFLYNNYLLIATIISDIPGRLAKQEQAHFKHLVDAYDKK